MKKVANLLVVCGVLLSAGVGEAQPQPETKPAPAAQLMASAQQRARKEHKAVLVMFHASWCGWCHRLMDAMNKPEHRKLFTDNYVIVSLDVSEQGAKKALENPGAEKLQATLGGATAGLPFYAFVDATGKQLANSNCVPLARGVTGTMDNIGYPASPQEIAAFEGLLKKTAPRMNATARQRFITSLSQTSPQRQGSATAQH